MDIRSFMTANVYCFEGCILICGACLPDVSLQALEQLASRADQVYSLCLEQTHFNMAFTKFSALMSTGKVTHVLLATVDRSPHCVQMHYLTHELERLCPRHVPVESYVLHDGRLESVSPEAIDLSKSLYRLTSRL